MTDRLPQAHLRDQLATLRSTWADPQVTMALIELASWLDGNRGLADAGLSAADRAVVAEVLRELREISDLLASRMFRPACLYSDTPDLRPGRFASPALAEAAACSWKPRDALWTSPLVGENSSSWLLMSELTGDAKRHSHLITLPHPGAESTALLESLAEADSLLASHAGSTAQTWRSLRRDGCAAVAFTWRCVLEAEISALSGERDPAAFPCGLGVECSLWLVPPPGPAGDSRTVPHDTESSRDGGWFAYGT